jgi:hemoglobin/transferrin/lactoferrin receptor protein
VIVRALFAAWLCAAVAWAGDDRASDIQKIKDLNIEDLLEVKAVSAVRHDQRQLDSPRSMSIVTGEELRRKNFRTVPEALQELAGVMVQQTNYAGGSPIIRGVVGNRVLILVDGMRLNSGSYRLGPNQYLNTIDINQVDRIEVIRGAGSVLYGTDALGGIIHIITKSPHPEESGHPVSAEISSRFASADRGIASRLSMAAGWKNLAMRGGFSGKRFGDLQPGRGAGRVPSSGYGELDGDLRLSYKLSETGNLHLSAARVRLSDACRTDVMQSGANLEYCWNPTQRDLVQAGYRKDNLFPLVDWMELRGRYETQKELLRTVATASPGTQSQYFDRANSHGIALEMGSHIASRQLFTYGFDVDRDGFTSSRSDHDLVAGTARNLPGNVPNGSTYTTLAGFLQDEMRLLGPLSLNLGGRYTTILIRGELDHASTGVVDIDNAVRDFSGSAFLSIRAGAHLRLLGGISQGFRAPNLNDEGFLGVSGTRFEIPNPALKPEKNITWEGGWKFSTRKFSGTASYFVSEYRGMIDRTPAVFAGRTFLDLNGNGLQDKGELAVYQRNNIGKASLVGGAVEGEFRFTSAWSSFGNLSWTRGDDIVNRTPLTRVPPVKGIFGQRWRHTSGFWMEAYTLFAGAQRRLSPSDRSDPRIRPGGTPGFATANLRGGLEVGHLGMLTVGLENLTNKKYRWHGSGIDAPGTNLVIGFSRSIL